MWSGGDDFVVTSGCGFTLGNRGSSLAFLVGGCFGSDDLLWPLVVVTH